MSNKKLVNTFYIEQYKLIKCFGVWKFDDETSVHTKFVYRLYFWFFFICCLIPLDVNLILQLVTHIDDVDEIIKVFIIFATALGVMGKYICFKLHCGQLQEVFQMLHKKEFLPQNVVESLIFQEAVDLSQKVRQFYTTLSVSALSALLMSQFLSEAREFPAAIYYPFDLESNLAYTLVYIYTCLAMAVLCFVNIAFDSLASSFLINIKGQLEILGYRLENVGRTGHVVTQTMIMYQLKECIIYYQRIMELTRQMEYLVSIPMSIQIACSVFVLIANFYAMSLLSGMDEFGNFVKILLYQTCMLTQIFILCYFANEVSLKSSELSFNLYQSDWFNWNKINRKLVLLMMIRFEAPIRIKTVNQCYSFNLAAFTSIVNSSYSYFALLKRINS